MFSPIGDVLRNLVTANLAAARGERVPAVSISLPADHPAVTRIVELARRLSNIQRLPSGLEYRKGLVNDSAVGDFLKTLREELGSELVDGLLMDLDAQGLQQARQAARGVGQQLSTPGPVMASALDSTLRNEWFRSGLDPNMVTKAGNIAEAMKNGRC